DATVLGEGENCPAPADCRQLALLLARNPELRSRGSLVCNEFRALSWSGRFPGLMNLIAFTVADQQALGWVLALNKKGAKGTGAAGAPFRNSDLALLTPFVSLLELQERTSSRFRDLKDLLVGLTRSLTAALDAKDPYTQGHSERVARIAVELGRELGME